MSLVHPAEIDSSSQSSLLRGIPLLQHSFRSTSGPPNRLRQVNMKIASSVGALLLASTALAAPAPSKMTQRRHERLAKRLANKHKTNPPLAVNHTSMGDTIAVNSPGFVQYDSNWAGAVIVSSGITEVTGTFTIPTVQEPSGGNSNTEYGAAAWVGIDGDTCQSAILQTGVEFLVEGDSTAYEAWYEWYPNYSYNFNNFDVSPGDQIKATVKATSLDSGTATLENLSTGSSVTHTFKNEASEGSLCETNAEWIVEVSILHSRERCLPQVYLRRLRISSRATASYRSQTSAPSLSPTAPTYTTAPPPASPAPPSLMLSRTARWRRAVERPALRRCTVTTSARKIND